MVAIPLLSIILILGIIGNGLVIWIAGFRMKKIISAVWFLNLAIADFLCCASIPLIIALLASTDACRTFSSLIFCSFYIIILNLNMSASVLLLTAMSVDRWVSVMWPFWAKVHRTQKRVRTTAGIIWVMSLIWTGITFYLMFLYAYHNQESNNFTINLISLVIMFVIPFLIIVTSYVNIFNKLRKSKRPQRSQRPYRIITAVILGFFICWAPYNIYPLTPNYKPGESFQFLIVTGLACFNSCINPVIYVLMGQEFKPSFLRFIPFRIKRALSEHPDNPCGEQGNCDFAPTKDI
ncbi:C5a anaphylatoxin chemotactic receptor 1-like [Engystomops pustulosus]|uniref:C5a anaphylatoxin chemotactic receptor 1-like n=1 Tax=Engystomops pustulosus TaxID=76066 RepID=UPI003AFB19BE